MNNREQRIAIAEALGATWQDVPPDDREWVNQNYHPKRLLSFSEWDFSAPYCAPIPLPDTNSGDAISIPDYTGDLNAIQKAIMSSTFEWCMLVFYKKVMDVMKARKLWLDGAGSANVFRAPADVWCEAFLKTIDKWTDD